MADGSVDHDPCGALNIDHTYLCRQCEITHPAACCIIVCSLSDINGSGIALNTRGLAARVYTTRLIACGLRPPCMRAKAPPQRWTFYLAQRLAPRRARSHYTHGGTERPLSSLRVALGGTLPPISKTLDCRTWYVCIRWV